MTDFQAAASSCLQGHAGGPWPWNGGLSVAFETEPLDASDLPLRPIELPFSRR